MPQTINTNIISMTAKRNLNCTQNATLRSRKLSAS